MRQCPYAAPAHGSCFGVKPLPLKANGRPLLTSRIGVARGQALVTPSLRSSSSDWHRLPTAPTAPAGCSPATAVATGSMQRSTVRATRASRPAVTAATDRRSPVYASSQRCVAHRCDDAYTGERLSVAAVTAGRLARVARTVERCIDPVATAVAGEHPAGAVGAV